MKTVHLLLPLLVWTAGCATTGGPPVVTNVPAGSPQAIRLAEGRSLFIARCQRCHALPVPGVMAPEKWPGEVAEMARKSQLDAQQTALVADYLVAASIQSRSARFAPAAPARPPHSLYARLASL
jgi:mono/diheme cytochrome c family protein